MRRQIILEIEEEGTENIVADIIGMMRDKVDMNCEFRISQMDRLQLTGQIF